MKLKGIIPELKMSEANKDTTYFQRLKSYKVVSVNTSSLFDGELRMLKLIRRMYPKKFLIRKDFIMIPKQIKESKEAGADAVLLIRNMINTIQYNILMEACKKYKIEPITELGGSGIEKALGRIVLINSRNLNTGQFNKGLAERRCIVYKSAGYNVIYASGENSDRVVKKGIADAVLIGTAFMRHEVEK